MSNTLTGGSVIWNLDVDDSKLKSGLASANNTVKDASKDIAKNSDSIKNNLSGIGDAFKDAEKGSQMFAKGLLAIGAAGVGALGFGIKMAADLETMTMGFVTLLGNAEAANEAISMIKRDAARTPFELPGLIKANQMLTAVTKDAGRSEELLLNVGKALTAMGRSGSELDNVIYNLQQISNTGKITEIDIRQFGNAGINVLEMLADYYGTTKDKAVDMVKNSKDAFADLEGAFKMAGEGSGRFAKAFELQGGTFNQVLSNFKDNLGITMSEVLKQTGIFDAVKAALASLTSAIGELAKPENIEQINNLFKTLNDNLPIVTGMIIGGLVPAVRALAISLWAAMAPLLPFILLGAALGVWFMVLRDAFNKFIDSIEIVKTIWIPGVKNAILWMTNLFENIKEKVGGIINIFKQVWDIITMVFGKYDNWELPDSVFNKYEDLINVLMRIREVPIYISMAFENLKTKIIDVSNQIKKTIVDTWSKVIDAIKIAGVEIGKAISIIAIPYIWLYKNVFEPIGLLIVAIVFRVFYEIGKIINDVMNMVNNTITNSWIAIFNFLGPILESIKNFFVATWTKIVDFTVSTYTTIKDFIVGIITTIVGAILFGLNFIKDEIVIPVFTAIKDFIIGIWIAISDAIKSAITFIKDAIIMPIFNAIKDFITSSWNSITDFTKKTWESIKQAILGPFNSAKSGVQTASSNLLDWIKSSWNNIVNFFINLKDSIVNAIVQPFKDAKSQIEKYAQEIKNAANEINPFTRHSPSLVDNVIRGVDVIKDQFKSLSEISIPPINSTNEVMYNPSTLNMDSNTSSAKGGSGVTVNIAEANISKTDDIEALGREFGFRYSLAK